MRDQDEKEKTGVETLLRFEGTARGRDKRSDNGRKCVVSQRSNDKERTHAAKTREKDARRRFIQLYLAWWKRAVARLRTE